MLKKPENITFQMQARVDVYRMLTPKVDLWTNFSSAIGIAERDVKG